MDRGSRFGGAGSPSREMDRDSRFGGAGSLEQISANY
jgi:hypothetical protein